MKKTFWRPNMCNKIIEKFFFGGEKEDFVYFSEQFESRI